MAVVTQPVVEISPPSSGIIRGLTEGREGGGKVKVMVVIVSRDTLYPPPPMDELDDWMLFP